MIVANKFPIDLSTDPEGLGNLIITDLDVLVRPAQPGPSHYNLKHDTDHAYRLLILGEALEGSWHIITSLSAEEANKQLDRVFYAFVDSCCMEVWCDAVVHYKGDDSIVLRREYGFEDGYHTMHIDVHCGLAGEEVEVRLNTLLAHLREGDRAVVVKPDSSEIGYKVEGWIIEVESNDEGCQCCYQHDCSGECYKQ